MIDTITNCLQIPEWCIDSNLLESSKNYERGSDEWLI